MIHVCDPPRARQVRRLSAEEFFTLVRCGGAGFYRPCTEVLRMLTAGEAWGTSGAALLVLPLTADTAAAAALPSQLRSETSWTISGACTRHRFPAQRWASRSCSTRAT